MLTIDWLRAALRRYHYGVCRLGVGYDAATIQQDMVCVVRQDVPHVAARIDLDVFKHRVRDILKIPNMAIGLGIAMFVAIQVCCPERGGATGIWGGPQGIAAGHHAAAAQ